MLQNLYFNSLIEIKTQFIFKVQALVNGKQKEKEKNNTNRINKICAVIVVVPTYFYMTKNIQRETKKLVTRKFA